MRCSPATHGHDASSVAVTAKPAVDGGTSPQADDRPDPRSWVDHEINTVHHPATEAGPECPPFGGRKVGIDNSVRPCRSSVGLMLSSVLALAFPASFIFLIVDHPYRDDRSLLNVVVSRSSDVVQRHLGSPRSIAIVGKLAELVALDLSVSGLRQGVRERNKTRQHVLRYTACQEVKQFAESDRLVCDDRCGDLLSMMSSGAAKRRTPGCPDASATAIRFRLARSSRHRAGSILSSDRRRTEIHRRRANRDLQCAAIHLAGSLQSPADCSSIP